MQLNALNDKKLSKVNNAMMNIGALSAATYKLN